MKTIKVKIHDREWFEKNCEKDNHGDYFMYGEWFINQSNYNIFGKVIYVNECEGGWCACSDYKYNIPEWAIDREITETINNHD